MKKSLSFIALFCFTILCNFTLKAQWFAQISGTTNTLYSVYFTAADIGSAVGDLGTIRKTINGGTNWTAQTSGTTNALLSVYFINPDTGYIVGGTGTILKTTNAGTNWTAQTSGTTHNLLSVYFCNGSTGYAVGLSGTIRKTTDGGANWLVKETGINSLVSLYSVWFTSQDTGYLAGSSGYIYKTINGGNNWNVLGNGSIGSLDLHDVQFISSDTGFVVGANSAFLKTTNGGSNWSSTYGGGNLLNSVFFTQASTGYAAGNYGGYGIIQKTTNGGTNWVTVFSNGSTGNLNSVYFPNPNTGYAVGASGTILKSSCIAPYQPGIITGSTTVCQGQNSVTYTVPAITNATSYVWTLPTGATGNSITNSITVNYGTSAASGNITVKGTNSCGDGGTSTLAITVNPLPVAAGTIAGAATVCQGQNSVTYTVPAITNATSYVWTLPTGATGNSITNSITVNYGASAASGNINVKGTNSCGYGAISTLAITVNPLPVIAGTIAGAVAVCQGQNTVTYTVPIITNATSYIWTLPPGASGTSATNSIIVDYGISATSGNITVNGHNSCGDGTSSSMAITVNPLPAAAGPITGNTTVCQGQSSVTYTVPVITNATSYIWTLPVGASGTSITNSIIVDYGTSAYSGNITVYGNNSCGVGSPQVLGVEVNIIDTSVSVSGLTLFSNAYGASYQWIDCNGNTPISGAINQSFTVTANGNYAVIVTKNSCSDTSACYSITTVGIFGNKSAPTVFFYPNPSKGKFTMSGDIEKITSIEIYNVFGEEIYSILNCKQKITNEMDLSEFSKGIYFVLIYNKGYVHKEKIVIQ
ncbi:MAG: YCF48-related protein [Bacteroidota bacterium]